jgi:outer membrane receptor protein involved in Fe transport
MSSKEYEPLPGDDAAIYDCAGAISESCFPQPNWRHVLTANYNLGDLGLTAKWRFLGEVENDAYEYDEVTGEPLASNDVIAGKAISSQSYIDVSLRYTISETVSTRLGVNNILDVEPVIPGNTLDTGAFYDQLGRYLHASVSFNF